MSDVTKAGRLTADPMLRFSKNGKPWVSFSLAVQDRVQDASGEWVDTPAEFFDVVAFGALAEHIAESLVKADRVIVTGRQEQGEPWTDKNGNTRVTDKIIADEVGLSLKFTNAGTL